MAWIESHQSLARHPKLLALARDLHIRRSTAVGMLQLLWWWAIDVSPEGEINISPGDIAEIMDWPKNPDTLLKSLTERHWVDSEDGRLFIHDWEDYTGKLVEQRELRRVSNREAQRRRRNKIAPRQQHVSTDGQHGNDDGQQSTVPNRTIPTIPSKTKKEVKKETGLGEFKNVYLSSEEHEKLITKLGDASTQDLIERLSAYMKSRRKKYDSHYATILNWSRDDAIKRSGMRTSEVDGLGISLDPAKYTKGRYGKFVQT